MGVTTLMWHRDRIRRLRGFPPANTNMPTPIPIMNNSVPAPVLVQTPSYVPFITPMPLLVPSPMHSSSNGEYHPLSNLFQMQQMQLQLLQQTNHTVKR